MLWALDIDGTIDANPSWFAWLTYHLKKPGNTNTIYVITCRNPSRRPETITQLAHWGILYDDLLSMGDSLPRDFQSLLEWKLFKLEQLKPDIWIDDSIKLYKQLYNIDVYARLPKCNIIQL